MCWVTAKLVPGIFSDGQKLQQFSILKILIASNENILKNVVTADMVWVYSYDIETKCVLLHLAPVKPNRCACK
jgi:hypothetical protein